MRRLMHVLDCTLTSTNESALLAAFNYGYEEQPECVSDASTSKNESEPRSPLDYFTSEQLFTLKPSEFAGETSPITTRLDKDKTNPSVLSTDTP